MNRISAPVLGATLATALIAGLGGMQTASAQGRIYAYPLNGQSQTQQRSDEFDCHQWAVQQSGFDPNRATYTSSTQSTQRSSGGSSGLLGIGGDKNLVGGDGNVLSDAATGAALGAIGGAIAGDPGTGAAIGAGASAIFGSILRSSNNSSSNQRAAAPPPSQAGQDDFRRAYSACMSGRGYRTA